MKTNKENKYRYCAKCGKKIDKDNYELGHLPLCRICRGEIWKEVKE